jgi:hypothetical protein
MRPQIDQRLQRRPAPPGSALTAADIRSWARAYVRVLLTLENVPAAEPSAGEETPTIHGT